MTDEDLISLKSFLEKYPTWWYRIGVCDLTRDFTCAPQLHSPEAKYIKIDNIWDNGFDCMHNGSIADAIRQVILDIESELLNETK